ncbi:MAG: type I DNA topoisomerase [Chloroflexi bacterium]|nr:type I DNA topoisomerase [Chloroflexota bacterium]
MTALQVTRTADGQIISRGKCGVCGSAVIALGAPSSAETKSPQQAELFSSAPVEHKTAASTRDDAAIASQAELDAKPTAPRAKKSAAPKRVTRSRRARANDNNVELDETDSVLSPQSSALATGAALVIVESPAKAKTISKFLGRNYRVRASVGHIRDLPVKGMGVDIEHDFKPKYEISAKKREVVAELKEYAQNAPEIYLATDPDREGEAISWHLASVLKSQIGNKPTYRVEFHEITRDAIQNAFSHPRQIDMARVNAQQARRVLDRIVGYTISPLLAKKMKKWTLSAGRVQSVAVRLVVEREREIQNFAPVEYWSIEAALKKQEGERESGRAGERESGRASLHHSITLSLYHSFTPSQSIFRARLVKIGDKDFECHSGEEALKLKEILEQCAYRVLDVRRKDVTRNPNAPYITSTLQQDASRRLGFNPKRTMKVAQELYEGIDLGAEGTVGLITYMRTDSTNVADAAQKEARQYVAEKFGAQYLPPKPRVYAKKVAGAQEAHEAIRPTKTFREPNAVRQYLDNDQFKLYDLIWKRFVASQMASAVFDTTAVDVEARAPVSSNQSPVSSLQSRVFLFRANGSILKFAGYLAVYGRSVGDEDEEDDSDKRLPPLEKNEPLDLLGIYPEQHFTEPPPRYTEATLIKALEQHGIGRPSTYAPIMANIQERDYIEQIEGRRLKPTELGFVVNDLLVAHFAEIVDLGFTAQMEEKLDAVEEGKQDWVQLMREFYVPFQVTLDRAAEQMPITRVQDEPSDQVCDLCGAPMVIKRGKYGKFLSCSRFPACKGMKKMTTGVRCPKCKEGEIRQRKSKKGRIFYGCSRYPDCDFVSWDKPIAEPCPTCGGLLVQGSKNVIRCVNGDYTREAANVKRDA